MLYLRSKVIKPFYNEENQIYEVDELCTYVGKNDPSNYSWVTFALNPKSNSVIDAVVGPRNKENLKQIIDSLKALSPKKIITDKLPVYPNLIKPYCHDTHQYSNNHIERGNLTLRTHIKRLNRKTICFSKSQKMLEASIMLYFEFRNWKLKME